MTRGRVVILSGDADTRTMLRLALESAGHEVAEAHNGLRLVSELHVRPPEVLIMETGTEWVRDRKLCESLSRHPRFRDIDIMIVSPSRGPGRVVEGLEAGAVEYFPEPLALGGLMQRVRETIEVRQARRAEAET